MADWSAGCTSPTGMSRIAADLELRCPTNKGDWVRFLASEVFLASQEDLLSDQDSPAEMEGVIIDFSDSGTKLRAFAVVELMNGQTIVVPVEKLTMRKPAESADDAGGN